MPSLREFAGLELATRRFPTRRRSCNFRHLLEEHDLAAGHPARGQRAPARARACCSSAGTRRGCHDHRRAQFDQERRGRARPGDAPDQEGQPVALRDEGAHRRGRRLGPGAHGGDHGGQRERRGRRPARSAARRRKSMSSPTPATRARTSGSMRKTDLARGTSRRGPATSSQMPEGRAKSARCRQHRAAARPACGPRSSIRSG